MFKVTRLIVTALLMATLLSGCYLMGKNKEYHPFSTQHLSELKIGVTTAEEICELFGAPTEIVELNSNSAYLYRRSVAKVTGLSLILISFGKYDKQYDQMAFFFDPNERLTHYGVSLDASKAAYGFPF